MEAPKMKRLLAFFTLIVLVTPVAQGQNGNNNGARVGKAGFLLNVNAYEQCPRGDMIGSRRHAIAVKADYTGVATDSASTANKIYLRSGSDFLVQDGNACDETGAFLELPITAANCANCNAANLPAPTFTRYEVRARVLGKPRGRGKITGCVEMQQIDPQTHAQTATSLCSVGDRNIVIGTRVEGSAGWQNVSTQLLTVCVDKSGDGVCDDRVGLFDSSGRDYWWSLDNTGHPHIQLVFFPVTGGGSGGGGSDGGGGSSVDPPPDPVPPPPPPPDPVPPPPDPGPFPGK